MTERLSQGHSLRVEPAEGEGQDWPGWHAVHRLADGPHSSVLITRRREIYIQVIQNGMVT